MKKFVCLFTLAALLCTGFGLNVGAAGFDYYCMRKPEHERPALESNFNFMNKYGAYYLGADDKVIYLTFDAGYENGNVEKVLDVLKAHNAHGAFFVLDNIIRRNTDLVIRMVDEGNLVCNHTSHHKDMTKLSREEFERELSSLESVYKELTGRTMSKFYRPPQGRFSEENLKFAQELGFKTVFWSFAYADWDNDRQPQLQKSIDLILKNTHNGEIILLHPTSATNAAIFDTLLTRWEEMGYRFGSLEELK